MANPPDLLQIIQKYAAGYFPMYDLDDAGREVFFWDRWPVRGILPLNDDTLARARRLGKRSEKQAFDIRHTTAVEDVIAQLGQVKEHSWVKGEVVAIYRALHQAGLLQTVEAWSGGKLAGALLGVALPGVFVAETMYGLVPEASKVCLCRLVEDCAARGFTLIDMQTPHDTEEARRAGPSATAHPCIRLGEVCVSLEDFLHVVGATWTREFDGDAAAWVQFAQAPVRVRGKDDPRRFLVPAGRPANRRG